MSFSATEQRMHTALLAAADLVNATARLGCGPILAKKHAPNMAALVQLTEHLAALGYIHLAGAASEEQPKTDATKA